MDWDIPCIDIAALLERSSPSEIRRTSEEIAKAARDYGFLTIKNHGVDAEGLVKRLN